MNDEELIYLVQSYDNLYDQKSPKFKNDELKRKAWEAISQELNSPVDECKTRWRTLRERYSREARCYKGWHLYGAMDFLKPHIKQRNKRLPKDYSFASANPSSLIKSELEEHEEFDISFLPSPCIESNGFDESAFSMEHYPQSPQDAEVRPPSSELTNSTEPTAYSWKRKRNNATSDPMFRDALIFLKNMCENQVKAENEETEAQALGRLVTAVTSKMSEKKQTKAIKEITILLMKIKGEPE